MNMTSTKNVIKGQINAIAWVFLYMIIQIMYGGILMYLYLTYSYEFKIRFLEVFSFISNAESLNDIEWALSMTKGFMQLSNEIILPMLGLTSMTFILLFAISIKKHKEIVIKKLSIKSIVFYIMIGNSLNLFVSSILNVLPEEIMRTYNQTVGLVTTGNILLLIVVAGILIPVTEEIVFRHFIFIGNKQINIKYAAVISAIAFGVAHGNLIQGIYAGIFGIIFIFYDLKEDNLLPGMIMHITINLVSVIISSTGINEMEILLLLTLVSSSMYIVLNYFDKKEETECIQ